MNITTRMLSALFLLAGLAWHASAGAQGVSAAASAASAASSASAASPAASAASAPAASGQGTQYTDQGADTCLGCHDADSDTATFSVSPIFKTRHAHRGDPRAPFGAGGLQCEACHGPGARHATKGSKKALTINNFKRESFLSVDQRNQACLTCHLGSSRTGWHAGTHERNNLACTDCHKIHVEQDPVLAKTSQPETCYRCHLQQRANFENTSSHPVRFGSMTCSDCHSAHGSSTQAMLIKPTLNQTCYSCHADKRGPLLWEHAPVAEDCSLCHTAHGSVRPALLNKSPPWLCQQCHSVAGHPSVARTANGLPGGGGGGSIFLVAGSCTNCHSRIHGSNHPSGAKLMR